MNTNKEGTIIVDDEVVQKVPFRRLIPEIPSTTYITHGIHSHPAKFIPQIPRYFITKYSQRGQIVLDPFCGSGTTLLEAMITGRNSLGVDINPLARLITKVKTTPIGTRRLKKAATDLLEDIRVCSEDDLKIPDFPNRCHWYEPEAEIELAKIKKCIEKYKAIDEDVYDFFRITFSKIARSASNADPGISKAYKSKKMRELLEKGRKFHVAEDFERQLKINTKAMDELNRTLLSQKAFFQTEPMAKLIGEDARKIELPDDIDEIDLIVTSPPFINAQNYYRSFKLQLFWLELINPHKTGKFRRGFVGSDSVQARDYKELHLSEYNELNKIIKKIYKKDPERAYVVYKYFEDMKHVFEQCKNTLGKGKYCCITLGDNTIRRIRVPTHKFIIRQIEDAGFETIIVGADIIRNRSLMSKRAETAAIMDVEWAMVFRKT